MTAPRRIAAEQAAPKPPAVRCPDCRRIIGHAQLDAGVGIWFCWHCRKEVWINKQAA